MESTINVYVFVQVQSCLFCVDLLHPPPHHGRLLSPNGSKTLGTETYWGGHAESGKV